MPSVSHGAVVDSIQRLFDQGTVVALGEKQLLDRFLSRGDESAFEAIVGRHGPMVLSVCRHVLHDQHEIEDAFQATFLILVKKAGSIRDRDVLGTWLYAVARRVAVRARANSRRRQSRERVGLESVEVQAGSIDWWNRTRSGPSWTTSSSGCHTGTVLRWCSAIWKARRTSKLPRSFGALSARSRAGFARPGAAALPPGRAGTGQPAAAEQPPAWQGSGVRASGLVPASNDSGRVRARDERVRRRLNRQPDWVPH